MTRSNACVDHKQYWEVMKDQFDFAIRWTWEEMSETGLKQRSFLLSHGHLLGMYADPKDIEDIKNAGEEYELVAQQLYRAMGACTAMRSMYHHAWVRVQRVRYRNLIVAQLASDISIFKRGLWRISPILCRTRVAT